MAIAKKTPAKAPAKKPAAPKAKKLTPSQEWEKANKAAEAAYEGDATNTAVYEPS